MQLTCLDRVVLCEIFPRFNSLENQVVVRELMNKLKLSCDDMRDVNLNRDEHGNVLNTPSWEKGVSIDILFSEDEIRVLKESIDFIDSQKRVTPEMINVLLAVKAL